MQDLISFGLLAFSSFFTLMNPLGVMPIYVTMTGTLDAAAKRRTATKAVLVAYLTLVLFALGGQLIFEFFGISVNGLRIVGGIIFFYVGQDMLNARLVQTKVSEEEVRSYVDDISITPLAIPMITGPGAITNAIVMMDDANTTGKAVVLFATMALVCGLMWGGLVGAARIMKRLGDTGNKVMMRLMGLIVMVIAVEFFFSGLTPILRSILFLEG